MQGSSVPVADPMVGIAEGSAGWFAVTSAPGGTGILRRCVTGLSGRLTLGAAAATLPNDFMPGGMATVDENRYRIFGGEWYAWRSTEFDTTPAPIPGALLATLSEGELASIRAADRLSLMSPSVATEWGMRAVAYEWRDGELTRLAGPELGNRFEFAMDGLDESRGQPLVAVSVDSSLPYVDAVSSSRGRVPGFGVDQYLGESGEVFTGVLGPRDLIATESRLARTRVIDASTGEQFAAQDVDLVAFTAGDDHVGVLGSRAGSFVVSRDLSGEWTPVERPLDKALSLHGLAGPKAGFASRNQDDSVDIWRLEDLAS